MIKQSIKSVLRLTLLRYSTMVQQSTCSKLKFPFSSVQNRIAYGFGFLKIKKRQQQFWITLQIKKATKRQQVQKLIEVLGHNMNIVHLTAILDRIQQQNIIKTKKIIDFVIENLKLNRQFFDNVTFPKIRTISNIICYLGNINNRELNSIFEKVNFQFPLKKGNVIQKTMLITGLIRLGLFHRVIQTNSIQKSQKKIVLSEIINDEFSLNQLLSIWYAYIMELSGQNQIVNSFFQQLISAPKFAVDAQNSINLITYAYAFICYVKIFHSLSDKKQNKLYQIVAKRIPTFIHNEYQLRPHQFSQLLQAIKQLSNLLQQQCRNIKSNRKFQYILDHNYKQICEKQNSTLRNIANCFKSYDEYYGINHTMIEISILAFINILNQQKSYIRDKQDYKIDYKIDLLSLSSLFWKINELYNLQETILIEQKRKIMEKLVDSVISYLKQLSNRNIFNQFKNKQLLMLYSGFYRYARVTSRIFDKQFQQISVNEIKSQARKWTTKQITLFYSYFKVLKMTSPQFCQYIKKNINKIHNTEEFKKIKQAKQIYAKQNCLMNLKEQCRKCFQNKSDSQNGKVKEKEDES